MRGGSFINAGVLGLRIITNPTCEYQKQLLRRHSYDTDDIGRPMSDEDYYDCSPAEGTERFDPESTELVYVSLEEWIEEMEGRY